jgi:predicted nucleic acid-binding protein
VILDTNGFSAMADGDVAVKPILDAADSLVVPAIVLGEYRCGTRQTRERIRNERWLIAHIPAMLVRSVDSDTAEPYAEIRHELGRKGTPIPTNDLWIAALARQHRLPVISRDVHFDWISGLERVGW